MCDALHYLLDKIFIRFSSKLNRQIVGIPMGTKDLWHFDRVSAYFSDASQIFPLHKISLVFFWIGRLMY